MYTLQEPFRWASTPLHPSANGLGVKWLTLAFSNVVWAKMSHKNGCHCFSFSFADPGPQLCAC